jgi:hypothetical protein
MCGVPVAQAESRPAMAQERGKPVRRMGDYSAGFCRFTIAV